MATCNTTTPAVQSAPLEAFEARARVDGFLNEEGFFVGPPDDVDVDPVASCQTT